MLSVPRIAPVLVISALWVASPALAVGPRAAVAVSGETRGLRFNQPVVEATTDGARVRGSVCRTAALPFSTAREVQVELVDRDSRVIASRQVRTSGSLAGRSPGCATYDLRQAWRMDAGDSLRVCLATRDGRECVKG